MQPAHVPRLDRRYWIALCLASVAGANAGDWEAHGLGFGHAAGLPLLAACFAAVLLAERRSAWRGTAFYWTAILLVRMAATNLADFLTHDLHLAYPGTIAVLGIATLLPALRTRRGRDGADGGPASGGMASGGWFWTAMLAAGALGTAVGDGLAGPAGFGTGPATLVLAVLPCLVLGLGGVSPDRLGYWLAVVGIRCAGTTAGDFLAGRLGLPVSTATFVLLLLLAASVRPRAEARAALAAVP